MSNRATANQKQTFTERDARVKTKLIWATPEGEKLIAYMARVSNPSNQDNDATAEKLVRYLWDNKHFSPFEMVDACFEIETTRDIARQMLRHRSFFFQEFSQRYADVSDIGADMVLRECRLQDEKNRQNSLPCQDDWLHDYWEDLQKSMIDHALTDYQYALQHGIAKEVARALLPEGLTPTRMYMKGSLRSWMHYLELRLDKATQKEHREVAESIYAQLIDVYPSVAMLIEVQ